MVFGKIIKIVATRSYLLKLKFTEFDFAGTLQQTSLGEFTALPRPPRCILGGPTSKGKEGRKKKRTGEGKGGVKREEKRRRKTKWEKRKEGKEHDTPPN